MIKITRFTYEQPDFSRLCQFVEITLATGVIYLICNLNKEHEDAFINLFFDPVTHRKIEPILDGNEEKIDQTIANRYVGPDGASFPIQVITSTKAIYDLSRVQGVDLLGAATITIKRVPNNVNLVEAATLAQNESNSCYRCTIS